MNKIIIFLFFILISSKLFSFDTLKPVRTVILEENDDIIFKNISSIALSPNMKNIAVVNGSWLTLSVHSTETGKILNYFLTDKSLSKYFTDKAYLYSKDFVYFPNYTVLGNDTSKLLGLDLNDLVNTFKNVKYLNDTTLMLSVVFRAWALDTNEENLKSKKNGPVIFNLSGFLQFDEKLKLKYGTSLESDAYKFANDDDYYPLSDTAFIFPIYNCIRTTNQDSLPAFAVFNKHGKRQSIISVLPDDYFNTGKNYNYLRDILNCKIKNKYIWTALTDYKIRNVYDKDDFFELKGFDTTNQETWITKTKGRFYLYLPILNMDVWQDSLIAVFTTNNNYNIQFYDVNGELIKHYILEKQNKVSVLKVAFASKYNKIYAISKDDGNYYINEYDVR